MSSPRPIDRKVRNRIFLAYGLIALAIWAFGESQWLWWRARRRFHSAMPWEVRKSIGLPPDWASAGARRRQGRSR